MVMIIHLVYLVVTQSRNTKEKIMNERSAEPVYIDHEANKGDHISSERQAEIDEIPVNKRCFLLAKSKDPKYKDYRGSKDGTIYKMAPGGQLRRVKKKETKSEKKARKAALKAIGKNNV
jgi:hypothetical protein